MNKLLIIIVVLAGSCLAAYLYYNPLETRSPVAVESDSTDPMPVISTAPEEGSNEENAEAVDASEEVPMESLDQVARIERLSKLLGGVPVENIQPAPMEGWYEVARGSAIGYVSEDGKFLIDGDLIDLNSKVNLTDKRRSDWRKTVIAGVDESQMIIFEPKKVKHTITVFTDVDCGYCRKLHVEMQTYLDEGIRIRYLFYPLRGEQAQSFKTAENVWCSKDRRVALTQAKLGNEVKAEACENPVAMHLQTGVTLGIRGTPGLITKDGDLLPGYMPAKALLAELEKS